MLQCRVDVWCRSHSAHTLSSSGRCHHLFSWTPGPCYLRSPMSILIVSSFKCHHLNIIPDSTTYHLVIKVVIYISQIRRHQGCYNQHTVMSLTSINPFRTQMKKHLLISNRTFPSMSGKSWTASSKRWSGPTLWPPFAAKTTLTHWGVDSSRPLKVSCGIWHHDGRATAIREFSLKGVHGLQQCCGTCHSNTHMEGKT